MSCPDTGLGGGPSDPPTTGEEATAMADLRPAPERDRTLWEDVIADRYRP